MLEKKAGKPMISVIMPCYNDEKYVALAIESVINQTYTDYEFYVIDNGSTDRSLEIINQYQKYITKIMRKLYILKKIHLFHAGNHINVAAGIILRRCLPMIYGFLINLKSR